MFQTKDGEKIKTHIFCSLFFFPKIVPLMRGYGEILYSSSQMTIWRMRIACSVPRATNKHPGCVIFTAFRLQQRLNQLASVLRYTYTLPAFLLRKTVIILRY